MLSKADRSHIHKILQKKGYYNSSIDGLYGKGTAAALKAYNKEYTNNAQLTTSSNVKVSVVKSVQKALTLDT